MYVPIWLNNTILFYYVLISYAFFFLLLNVDFHFVIKGFVKTAVLSSELVKVSCQEKSIDCHIRFSL